MQNFAFGLADVVCLSACTIQLHPYSQPALVFIYRLGKLRWICSAVAKADSTQSLTPTPAAVP